MKYLKYPVILLMFVLTACQSLDKIVQEPGLSLNSVDIAGISISGVDLVVHVDVENPNGFSIPLPKIDWELFINSSSFIRGGVKSESSLGSRRKSTVDFPVSVTYKGIYNSFASLIETMEAAYQIKLGISFPLPIIASKVYNLDFSGVLPLPRFPKLNAGQIRISKIDFTGIELGCEVKVENPNAFPIPFPTMNWDYGINGVPVLKSRIAGAGEIAAGAAGAVLIGVGVAYEDILKAVGSLRNAGEAKTNLSLGMDSEGLSSMLPALGDAARNAAAGILDIPGVIPILRKPEVSFQGITRKASSGLLASLTSFEFVLNWEVTNPNNFAMGIGEFIYDFRVNNSSWAQGRIDKLPRLNANGKAVIPLTVSVSALSLVRELADIISRGTSVTYNCGGNMSFTSEFPGLDKLDFPLNLQGSTRIQ